MDDLEPLSELSDSSTDNDTNDDSEPETEPEYDDGTYEFDELSDSDVDNHMDDKSEPETESEDGTYEFEVDDEDPTVDEDDPMDGSVLDRDFIPDYSQSRDPPAKPAAPKKSKKSRMLEAPLEHMPFRWVQRLQRFFSPEPNSDMQRTAGDVVHDFCQMRDLPKRDYNNIGFQTALKVRLVMALGAEG